MKCCIKLHMNDKWATITCDDLLISHFIMSRLLDDEGSPLKHIVDIVKIEEVKE